MTHWVKDNVTDFVWNPVLRAEVRHNLRKLRSSYARTAWNALRSSEKSGHLSYGREKLQDLLEHADDLSAEKALAVPAGTWDFFHVAAALRVRAQVFATCDKLQAELARAVNIPVVKLFKA